MIDWLLSVKHYIAAFLIFCGVFSFTLSVAMTPEVYPSVKDIEYQLDKRTNLCYALLYRRLATVPCSEEVINLIDQNKD